MEVSTDAAGFDTNVYLTAMCQTVLLNLGESPFFGNIGIPAVQSVAQQVPPDYFAAQIQTFYAPYFAALTIQRIVGSLPPKYTIAATAPPGAILSPVVAL